ncbi:MAG: DUF1697 domain-containing protein [Flavobacterium sp.]|nr:DUF1697 domain-containing protein [Flavobacterium sp.]
MKTYLVLLRGINVSGTKMIKMDALTKALQNIGFTNVQTYIQSGNVFVNSTETAAKVGLLIKQEIFKIFGHDVPAIVIDKLELKSCFENNPFLNDKNTDTKKLYVAFVSKELNQNSIHELKISQFKPDEAVVDGSKIYIKYDIGAGKTRLDQKYIEKKLTVTATIRNWNTVTILNDFFE